MTFIAAAIIGVGAVGGAYLTSQAARSAANKQADAAKQANQLTANQFQQTRSDLSPWVNAGQAGLTSLMNLSGMPNNQPLQMPSVLANAPIMPELQNAGSAPKAPTRQDAWDAMYQWHLQTYGQGFNKYSNMAVFNKQVDDKLAQMQSDYQNQLKDYQAKTAQYKQTYDQALQKYNTDLSAYHQQQQAQQQAQQPAQQPAYSSADAVQKAATQQALNPAVPASAQLAGSTQNAPLLSPFSLQDFQKSPAYEFNLSEGMRAINQSAAARGNYYAPQTLRDLSSFAQGNASNEYMNAYNMYNQNQANVWQRLFGLAGTGQNAAAQTGAFGANATNVMGQNTIGAGNAQAAGTIGQANAITGGMGDLYNAYLTQQILASGRNQQSMYAPYNYGSAYTGSGTYGFAGVGGAPY